MYSRDVVEVKSPQFSHRHRNFSRLDVDVDDRVVYGGCGCGTDRWLIQTHAASGHHGTNIAVKPALLNSPFLVILLSYLQHRQLLASYLINFFNALNLFDNRLFSI